MKISLTGVDAEFARIEREIAAETKLQMLPEVYNLVKELEAATPVDTGFARASWHLANDASGLKVSNDAPYIERLNNGSSKQAPRFFVERICLEHGKPVGAIVETYPET